LEILSWIWTAYSFITIQFINVFSHHTFRIACTAPKFVFLHFCR
jgi:hypothetical protein